MSLETKKNIYKYLIPNPKLVSRINTCCFAKDVPYNEYDHQLQHDEWSYHLKFDFTNFNAAATLQMQQKFLELRSKFLGSNTDLVRISVRSVT